MGYVVGISMEGQRKPIFVLSQTSNRRQAVGDAILKLIRTCRVREIHAITVTRAGGLPPGALTLRDMRPAAAPAEVAVEPAPRRKRRTWKTAAMDAVEVSDGDGGGDAKIVKIVRDTIAAMIAENNRAR